MSDEPRTFGLDEVAKIAGVHVETIRRAIRSGELAAFKLARNYRVSKPELSRWWTARGGGQLFEDRAAMTSAPDAGAECRGGR